jgi:hypothetical protein
MNRFTRTQDQEVWREYLDAKNRKGKIIDKAKRKHFRESMRDAGDTRNGLWRVAKWARNRSEGKSLQFTIPTPRRDAIEATLETQLVWPSGVPHGPPVAASHSRTVPLSNPEATSCPSGENTTVQTECE